MSIPILFTKIYIPQPRPELVHRSHLIKKLNSGLQQKLTLVSAPAGFGKTTVVTDWLQPKEDDLSSPFYTAWFSLDERDNDPVQFLIYMIAALVEAEAIDEKFGTGMQNMLQSPQPPPVDSILISLINEISSSPDRIIFVFDDYHQIQDQTIHDILTFLLENLPSSAHLVITTREDPSLPLARLRVQNQLSEIRASDLLFSSVEAGEFFNQVMGLSLSEEDIALLETRTEGWIAGLQLAAISMQSYDDVASFIRTFSGSDRMVLDYLIEEVINQQPEDIQNFLLQTAILNRLSGSLCNAVTDQRDGQAVLEMLERANLFIIPLDNQRRWYRYHHLFADLLRQRLKQKAAANAGNEEWDLNRLHERAGIWYENNDLEVEAFHHAAAANDVERVERLIEGGRLSLYSRGMVISVINWLKSLPASILNASPSLWVIYARVLLAVGQTNGVEEKLQAAESAIADQAALQISELKEKNRDLVGRIATHRATLALGQHQTENVISQAHRALEHLHPDNLQYLSPTNYKLGYAYQLKGDREAATHAYYKAISISQEVENFPINIIAFAGLGKVQELENRFSLAAESYQRVLKLFGDQPLPIARDVHLGLARIFYEWNDLDKAQQHGEQSLQLARQYESNNDRYISSEVFLARLKLVQGDVVTASEILAEAERSVKLNNFVHRVPEVVAAQVQVLLRQGNLESAADLAVEHDLTISRARVNLAQGDPSEALKILDPWRQHVEEKGWEDERLKVVLMQALVLFALDEKTQAIRYLGEVLALTEPEGFIRTFVDEGPPMARLLYAALSEGVYPDYVQRLLAAFPTEEPEQAVSTHVLSSEFDWVEPLSEREIEVLHLIAEGLSRQEIATQLVLSLNTVKSHARNIYGKLGVNNQMQAVGKARGLGLLNMDQAKQNNQR